MSNWAIVIGINKYWNAQANLQEAVSDALKVKGWLLDPNGGNVPENQLYLLLSPHGTEPDLPDPATYQRATRDNIIATIEGRLLADSGGAGDRLYLYFGGHGLTTTIGGEADDAIVADDITDVLPDKAISIDSLLERFEVTQFKEQFFFIDACRDIPFTFPFRISKYPRPNERTPGTLPVDQFVCYATSPGIKANETSSLGGVFTNALCDCLTGMSTAQVYDPDAQHYIVRWDKLFETVEKTVVERRIVASAESANLIQRPRQAGERSANNPIIVRFQPEHFPKLKVTLALNRPEAVNLTEVQFDDLSSAEPQLVMIGAIPQEIELPPRKYFISPFPPNGFISRVRRFGVEIYRPKQIDIELDVAAPGAPVATRTRALPGATATVTVTTSPFDNLAVLELLDPTGKLVQRGMGTLIVPNLKPGFYSARLVTPDNQVVEQSISLDATEDESVTLAPPVIPSESLVEKLTDLGPFHGRSSRSISLSESLGNITSPSVPSVASIIGNYSVTGNAGWLDRLDTINLPLFETIHNSNVGWRTILAVEAEMDQVASSGLLNSIRLQMLDGGEIVAPHSVVGHHLSLPGLYDLSASLPAGYYRMSFGLPDRRLHLPITVVADRVTLVVLYYGEGNVWQIYQYMSPNRYPPENLRRLELMQRYAMHSQSDVALSMVKELAYDKWVDPLAGCLSAYMMLQRRDGDSQFLETVVGNLTEFFPSISDSHVLAGEFYARQGNTDQSRVAFLRALERGLPLLQDGLGWLLGAVEHHQLNGGALDPLLQTAFDNRQRGMLWSVWK